MYPLVVIWAGLCSRYMRHCQQDLQMQHRMKREQSNPMLDLWVRKKKYIH